MFVLYLKLWVAVARPSFKWVKESDPQLQVAENLILYMHKRLLLILFVQQV